MIGEEEKTMKAHPDKQLVWPDQAELICWLMDQLDDAMVAVECLDDQRGNLGG